MLHFRNKQIMALFVENNGCVGYGFVLGDLQKLPKEKRKKIEKQLIDIVWEYYPDATSIRLFRGNILVTLP